MGVLSDWMSRIAAQTGVVQEAPYLAALAEALPGGERGEIAVGAGRCACFRGRVGKFTYTTYQVAMAPAEAFAETADRIRTALAIEFPAVEGLSFEIRKDTWDVEPNCLMEEFLFGISARFSCDELKAFMHERDFLRQIHGILSQRLGEIACDAQHFWVIVEEEIRGQRAAQRFVASALRIFQRFAQSAQLITPAWRAPAFGHDWWQPLDLPQDDAAPPDDLSSARIDAYLRRNYALPGRSGEQAVGESESRKIDPKAFVLCSSCLTDLDETRVDCPACGAGHHWTCAVGLCGECGVLLECPAQPPAIPVAAASRGARAGEDLGALPAPCGDVAARAVPAHESSPLPALPLTASDGSPPALDRKRRPFKLG